MTAVGADSFIPPNADLSTLRAAARRCHGCDLYRHASRTVFGEGPVSADIVMVGEQPGDQEDTQGNPFVGPAGHVLDRALGEIGIDRDTVYLTNAVKHFKFIERGKRRIHQPPGRTEIVACTPWFAAELSLVAPKLVVCLGSVAAKTVLGQSFLISRQRGQLFSTADYRVLTTVHPASVLRARDRTAAYTDFVADLRKIDDALS